MFFFFLNCVTEFIQAAVGSKYLPGGPHFDQLWFSRSYNISLISPSVSHLRNLRGSSVVTECRELHMTKRA